MSRKKVCQRCGEDYEVTGRGQKYCPPCAIAKEREYRQTPEYKAKQREYRQAPEYKAKQRECDARRRQKPEYRAKQREHDARRRQKPEYRAKKREREALRRDRLLAVSFELFQFCAHFFTEFTHE